MTSSNEPHVYFQVGEHSLRLTKLAAFPATDEWDKLLKQLDSDPDVGTGLLDTLAFSMSEEDHKAMFSASPSGLLLWLKSVATLLSRQSLRELISYYLKVGQVEIAVNGGTVWMPFQDEKQVNAFPSEVMLVATWQVLREVVRPFVSLFQSFAAKAKVPPSGSSTSPSEATSEQPAPT